MGYLAHPTNRLRGWLRRWENTNTPRARGRYLGPAEANRLRRARARCTRECITCSTPGWRASAAQRSARVARAPQRHDHTPPRPPRPARGWPTTGGACRSGARGSPRREAAALRARHDAHRGREAGALRARHDAHRAPPPGGGAARRGPAAGGLQRRHRRHLRVVFVQRLARFRVPLRPLQVRVQQVRVGREVLPKRPGRERPHLQLVQRRPVPRRQQLPRLPLRPVEPDERRAERATLRHRVPGVDPGHPHVPRRQVGQHRRHRHPRPGLHQPCYVPVGEM